MQGFEEQVGVWRSGISTGAFGARRMYVELSESGTGGGPEPAFQARLCKFPWFQVRGSEPPGTRVSTQWTVRASLWRSSPVHCFLPHSAAGGGGGIAALRFYQRAEIGTHLGLIALGQCLNINQGVGGVSVKELQCRIRTAIWSCFVK